jgi:hypothetical protein
MSQKKPLPTVAQAKRLAGIWGEHKFAHISEKYSSSTDLVLIKRGWLFPTGAQGKFPSGAAYAEFYISADGLEALERFLWNDRIRMKKAA